MQTEELCHFTEIIVTLAILDDLENKDKYEQKEALEISSIERRSSFA